MKVFQPVIKWTGSKRSQSNEIVSYFPKEIETYYEPFCGGCSVLRELLDSDIKVENYICSDNNHDLIMLWKTIKMTPSILSSAYRRLWNELNKNDDIERKKYLYEEIRNRFNMYRNPMDFMFLNRTCYNGLIRYNTEGDFNTSFHFSRKGIGPDKFDKIVNEWSELLNDNKVAFLTKDYRQINPYENDFMYIDPPYTNTNGVYTDDFTNAELFEWIRKLKCDYALSYNGKSGNEDNTYNVPTDLYTNHVYIKSGNSSFKRIKKSDTQALVYESLYINKKNNKLLL